MKTKKKNFRVKVHPAGLIMLAVAFIFSPSHTVLALVLALLLHEGAHMLIMLLFGVQECTIELTPFGGMADVKSYERLSCMKQILIAAAGVIVSGAAAMLCLVFAPRTSFWYAFLNANFSLAFINCLPVWPLDGARVIMAIAMIFGVQKPIRRMMLILAYVLGAALIGLGLYGAWHGYMNFSLLLIGPYLCYAAHESAIVQNLRHVERANDARDKLSKGGVMPVRVLATSSEPTSHDLVGVMLKMPPQQFHLLCVVDQSNGRVEKVITEQEMAKRVFS
ncbi:MAG: hypothetical protein GX096_15785 [Clostridiales bacterium]|nr:hypothetical protein [Clostridiales bacterium]